MKKIVLITAVVLSGFFGLAQNGSGFGIKGGINYAGNGDFFDSAENAVQSPDRNVGYHVGVFGKLGNKIYIRPELVYTSTTSDYDEGDLRINKLDVPVLVGIKVIGPLSIFAGPAFQYILNSKFDGVTIDNIENDFTVGLNIGAGVSFGKFGLDVRYERGFSENELNFIDSTQLTLNDDRVDTRPDQIILSLSLKL
ncbi:porin family protein [Maribacter antarcticus]|uniref:porin family protein n=1 Tax=Maribacter antarcticus TaxID=505250 RepID=UPI00047A4F67|nr:porin family protein [Maribacter antarcticus]